VKFISFIWSPIDTSIPNCSSNSREKSRWSIDPLPYQHSPYPTLPPHPHLFSVGPLHPDESNALKTTSLERWVMENHAKNWCARHESFHVHQGDSQDLPLYKGEDHDGRRIYQSLVTQNNQVSTIYHIAIKPTFDHLIEFTMKLSDIPSLQSCTHDVHINEFWMHEQGFSLIPRGPNLDKYVSILYLLAVVFYRTSKHTLNPSKTWFPKEPKYIIRHLLNDVMQNLSI
jgi:hypothetical protein